MAVIASLSTLITEKQAFDGWGNNVVNPSWGAARWPYTRLTVPDYDGNDTDLTLALRSTTETANISIPTGDATLDPYSFGNVTIPLFRTNATSIYVDPRTGTNTREYLNQFTSTLDASGLYGNDDNYAAIMIGERGMLKSWFHPVAGELPLVDNSTGIFTLGGPYILCVPTMLLREHNRRARQYAITNPNWTDAQIFNRARRMVISIMQKITLERYYPMILGELPPAYAGYDPNVDPTIDLFWSNVAQRYGHSSLNQVLLRYDEDGQPSIYGHVRLHDAMDVPTVRYILETGIEPFLRGFAMQPENMVDSRIVQEILQGLPDYNTVRRQFNMSEISTWSDLTPDTQIQGILASLYPNISRLDAFIGAMIEPHEGNAIVGPLIAASIKDQLLRIRDGDRFWWENPGVLTSDELAEMNNHSGMGQANPLRVAAPCELFTGISCSPSTASSPEEGMNIMGMLTFKWTLKNAGNNVSAITFILESNSTGWFGFGIGDNMNSPADMYLCIPGPDGVNWTVQDSYSTDFIVPKADILVGGTNNVIDVEDLTATQTASARVLRFTRYLNTGDPHDTVIASGVMPLLFAYGDVPVLGYHGPGNRAHVILDFFDTGSQIIVVTGTDSLPKLKVLHGMMMALAFGVFYPSGIFIARFWHDDTTHKCETKNISVARRLQIIIAALTAIIGTYGDMTFTHSKIGITVATLVLVSTVSGLVVSKAHTRFPLEWSKRMRSLHRYSGYCGYLLGVANGFIGVLDISGNDWSLAYVYAGYVITVIVTLSGFFQISKTRPSLEATDYESSKSSLVRKPDHSPLFTWQEVAVRVRAGAKWLVIENWV
ncbi:heme peroxidase, partial [Blyttiomyces helicus]